MLSLSSGSELRHSLSLQMGDPSMVGEARRTALTLARDLGLDETTAGRIGIIVTELGTNLVRHAKEGAILLRTLKGPARLEILSVDRGPGMTDVGRCMVDGFTSGSTMGAGLGAVRRLSSRFDIHSLPGKGTVVYSLVGAAAEADANRFDRYDLGVVCTPHPMETISGDGWTCVDQNERVVAAVVDGLGHGASAADAAEVALEVVHRNSASSPADLLKLMNNRLRSTRGAAASIAHVDFERGQVVFAGIGNVRGCVVRGGETKGLICYNGTLGLQIRSVQNYTQPLETDDLLIIHSDGLSSKWDLSDYPGLATRAAPVISAVLHRDWRRSNDDATVLTLKLRMDS